MADSTKWVWLRDEKSLFVKATVVAEEDDYYCVRVGDTSEVKEVSAALVEKVNPPQFDKVGDMAELTYLNEPSVIYNLSSRWFDGNIYTYSGLFLVAVNPYKSVPLYGEKAIKEFRGKRRDEVQPHIYAVAEQAYRSMIETRQDQSILITGESGAGKTENTKNAIQYLSSVTNGDSTRGIDVKILQTNPILEAFGNAQTIRNSNSSRFGKFIKIQFDGETEAITGASIQWYLLEKSRVITQHKAERNYHVFYQFLAGAPAELKRKLYIPANATPKEFTYLSSGAETIEGIDDAKLYSELVEAFTIMGFSTAEVEAIMKLIASVLLLGEIQFKATSADQGSVTNMDVVKNASNLLGVDALEFINSILKPRVKIGREFTTQSRNAAQALHTTNAVAKALYERLFGYIVVQLNCRLGAAKASARCIGVLDIAGFEIFEKNSFEQLCINYTNEKLQQFFNHHMFVLEQEEYLKEKVNWDYIDYGSDLQPTIDLIEQAKNPMGIFSCLNEESVFPNGNDASFSEKLIKQWEGKNSKFTSSRLGQGFVIDHYAQRVEYQTDGWLEKNKDPLSDAVEGVLATSSMELVRSFFAPGENNKAKGKTTLTRTVAQRHKEQLNSLMEHLGATQPHFVRCIIPNTGRSPSVFDNPLVLDQLRYNGVLEGIRIARSGFPNRLEFLEFCRRYKALAGSVTGPLNSQQTCATILQRIKLDPAEYKVGLSKVFFRNGVLAKLEHDLEQMLAQQCLEIQSLVRGALARMKAKRELHRRRAAKLIAHCFRQNNKNSNDPWYLFNQTLKPLLLSKDSMDSSKKDLRMQKLESSLHKLEHEQEALMTSNNEIREQLIESMRAKQEATEQLERLQKEMTEREEAHEQEAVQARGRDEASASALRELGEKFAAAHEELTTLRENEEMLQNKLTKTKGEMEPIADEVAKLKTKLQEQEQRANLAVENRDQLQEQLKAASTKLSQERTAIQEERDSSLEQLERQKGELSDLKSKIAAFEEVNSTRHDWESKMAEKDKQIGELKEQMSSLTKELSGQRDKSEHELIALRDELELHKAKYIKLEATHAATTKELQASKETSADTSEKLSTSEKELLKLREWLAKAKTEIKAAAQAHKDLANLQETHKVLGEKSTEVQAKLEKDLAEAQASYKELQKQLTESSTDAKLQDMAAENRKLHKDLDTATENLLKANEELLQTTTRLDRMAQRMSSTETELRTSKASVTKSNELAEGLRADLVEARSQAKSSEITATKLKKENESLNSRVTDQAEQIKKLQDTKREVETELAATSQKLRVALDSQTTSRETERLLEESRKELAHTQATLRKLQTQSKADPEVASAAFRGRFIGGDAEHQLANTKQSLVEADAQINSLKSELERARAEVAKGIILRQKYEKLQRDKALLAQDRSQMILGVKPSHTQTRELEVAKAQVSEVKRLQSELKVLKLTLLKTEQDRKAIEGKLSLVEGNEGSEATLDKLRHKLRVTEISNLQLSKKVNDLTRNRSAGISMDRSFDGEPLDPHDPPLSVKTRDIPQALRNISNDRRVSEQAHLAAEQLKNTDLEDALDIYQKRAKEFHMKLEKAELVVESAVRAERAAKQQVEDYKQKLDRIEDDHYAEIAEMRHELNRTKLESDAKDARIESLMMNANFSADLQDQIKTMNSTLKELSGERDRLAKDKAKLETRLHDMVSSFDTQPRMLQDQVKTLKQNEQHLMREHGDLRWKLERKSRLIDQQRRSLQDAEKRIEQCRQEIDRLQANESAREIAIRRANREISETNEKYLMAERELEQYRLARSTTKSPPLDTRPAFI